MSAVTRMSREHLTSRISWRWVATAILFAAAITLPFLASPYIVGEVTMVLVFACAIMGLNLLTGYLGQISLGHGALLGLGAYTAAIINRDTNLPVVATVLATVVITFFIGLVIGILVLRVQGIYLALITLTIALAMSPVIKRFPDLTGGSQGIVVVSEPPGWFGLADDQAEYLSVLVCLVLVYVVVVAVVRGRSGRALRAIKDNELVARAIGINLALVKAMTFAASAALCGLGGALYAITVGFVSPESFSLLLSAHLLAAMVIGGGGTLVGPIIGAAFYQYLPIVSASVDPALGGLIYGVALVVVMLAAPKGVASIGSLVADRWRRRAHSSRVEPQVMA